MLTERLSVDATFRQLCCRAAKSASASASAAWAVASGHLRNGAIAAPASDPINWKALCIVYSSAAATIADRAVDSDLGW